MGRSTSDASPRATPEAILAMARTLVEEGSPPGREHLRDLESLLRSPDPAVGITGARAVGLAAGSPDAALAAAALEILRAAATSASIPVARRGLQLLVPTDTPSAFRETLSRALEVAPSLLDDETIAILAGMPMGREMIEAFAALGESLLTEGGRPEAVEGMVRLIVAFGATHPSWYRRLRLLLTRGAVFGASTDLRQRASVAREELENSFRRWLGPAAHIAVAPETGEEYGWDDVVCFDAGVPPRDRHRLLVAIKHSPLIREAILLVYDGASVELGHLVPGGIRIQPAGQGHGKAVYRAGIQVRGGNRYEIVINLARDLPAGQQREETDYLILCGDDDREPVVERFGGYWPASQLWTEESIPGDSLATTLERLAQRPGEEERFTGFWPYAAWSAMAAYIEFWNRTRRRIMVADPGPENVFVPLHDYHLSARLLSIAERTPCTTPAPLLRTLHEHMVAATEHRYPRLQGHATWETVFSAFLGAVGETEGIPLLQAARTNLDAAVAPLVDAYLDRIASGGYLPPRLYFAIKRYGRWSALNPGATAEARADTLRELHSTYALSAIERRYPETTARFFRETVLADAAPALAGALDRLVRDLRTGILEPAAVGAAILELGERIEPLDDDVQLYLHRLARSALGPAREATTPAAAGNEMASSDVVVTVRAADGAAFRIRHALSPGEVEALREIFTGEGLPVEFTSRHRFLLAVGEGGRVSGGLFYQVDREARTAHMDKVVVAHRFRNKGLATALMDELARRLVAAGVETLTTGFFRPQFFRRHGFRVDPRHPGLVKDLTGTHTQASESS